MQNPEYAKKEKAKHQENYKKKLKPHSVSDKKALIPNGKKYCPRCQQIKDKSEFFKEASSACGVGSYCKKCKIKMRQESMSKRIDLKIYNRLRRRMQRAVSKQFTRKANKTRDLLGCTPLELKKYLESKFQQGMSWDNYGMGGWVIDHIKPCVFFDLTDPSQQKECFHYTNLQPLWEKENNRKSDKIGWVAA